MRTVPLEGLHAVAWTMWIVTGVDFFLVAGRFIIRWRKIHRFGWDDYLNAFAWVLLLGFCITNQLFIPIEYSAFLFATGKSELPPSQDDIKFGTKLNIANCVMFMGIIFAVKASFLALYWRIFGNSNKFRIAWGLVAAYTVISFFIPFPSYFLKCGSAKDFTDTVNCSDSARHRAISLFIAFCALNVSGDLFLMILPVVMLSQTMMKWPQKLGIAVTFCLVLFIIVFDILRVISTLRMKPDVKDETALWAFLEPAVAVMVCALPCYRGLLSWGKTTSVFKSFIGGTPRSADSSRTFVPEQGDFTRLSGSTKGGAQSTQSDDKSNFSSDKSMA